MSSFLPSAIISENSISSAWRSIFFKALDAPQGRLGAHIVEINIHDEDAIEDSVLRSVLDKKLLETGNVQSKVTAMLLFPVEFWKMRNCPDSKSFSDICTKRLYPRLRARDRRNAYGTYFYRAMNYEGHKDGGKKITDQISYIIELLNRRPRPRATALQIMYFDPAEDHTGQCMRGFPCLNQVSITYNNRNEIHLTGIYPKQYIFERAYGNYLGLYHLGLFIADQTNMKLKRVSCLSLCPVLGDISKSEMLLLKQDILR